MRHTWIFIVTAAAVLTSAITEAGAQVAVAGDNLQAVAPAPFLQGQQGRGVPTPPPASVLGVSVRPPGSAVPEVPARRLGGFSVSLVLGDLQSSAGGTANLPAAAAKALTDLKDFLPYKSYRLLDTEWTMGSERATTRLRGLDDKEYELALQARQTSTSNVAIPTFVLRETNATTVAGRTIPPNQASDAAQRVDAIVKQLADARLLYGNDHPNVRALESNLKEVVAYNTRVHELQEMSLYTGRLAGALIDTSFSLDVGETVVVGTSRLQGDKALIVLLTAVPR